MFKAIDRFSAPMGKMTASVARMADKGGSSVKQLNTGFDKIGGGLKTVAVAAGAMGVAAGAALVGMAAPGADFEKAMVGVGAMSLMTRDQVADLENQLLSPSPRRSRPQTSRERCRKWVRLAIRTPRSCRHSRGC